MIFTRVTDTGGDWEALYAGNVLIDQNPIDWWWHIEDGLFDTGAYAFETQNVEVNLEMIGQCPGTLEELEELIYKG